MRKYQQLLLLIISFVSIITLIFYRNEYLKLRSVLAVLNFFGSVNLVNSSCLVFNTDLKASAIQRYKYAEPRSAWVKLDSHFIYSSFWEDSDVGGTVQTITVGPQSTFFNYNCRIWFEEGDIIISHEGMFMYDVDSNYNPKTIGETVHQYNFKCVLSHKLENKVPYGVLWSTSSNTSIFSPVFKVAKEEDSAVICVSPDYTGIPKIEIIEFISYYNTIGVTDFIIYDSGIQHSIFPFLESVIGSEVTLKSFTIMTWNFPFISSRSEFTSLRADCLTRTYKSAKLVAIVAWNEYIVPSRNNFNSVLSNEQLPSSIDISLEEWLCCTNTRDDVAVEAFPIFLRKTVCAKLGHEEKLFINIKSYINQGKKSVKKLSPNVAIIRRYDSCNSSIEHFKQELPFSKFYFHVISHKLLNLWKSHLNSLSIFN